MIRKRVVLWALGIFGLLVAGFVTLLAAWLFIELSGIRIERQPAKLNLDDPNVAKKKLAEVSRMMKIDFPSTARLLNVKEFHGLDYSIYVAIELPMDDLQSFIKGTPLAGIELLQKGQRYINELGRMNWLDPTKLTRFKWGKVILPNAELLKILIDLSHDDKAIIYLGYLEM